MTRCYQVNGPVEMLLVSSATETAGACQCTNGDLFRLGALIPYRGYRDLQQAQSRTHGHKNHGELERNKGKKNKCNDIISCL